MPRTPAVCLVLVNLIVWAPGPSAAGQEALVDEAGLQVSESLSRAGWSPVRVEVEALEVQPTLLERVGLQRPVAQANRESLDRMLDDPSGEAALREAAGGSRARGPLQQLGGVLISPFRRAGIVGGSVESDAAAMPSGDVGAGAGGGP
jgi:hypothetical protein